MTILLANDDGINAPGLYVLAETLLELDDVYIVAPETEQSAVGHAITIRNSIRISHLSEKPKGVKRMSVNGTPADAVKFAIRHHLNEKPTLLVSGPNTGPNVGVNVLYSGTVAAAFEANFWGVSSVAVSSDIQQGKYNWTACCKYAYDVVRRALELEKDRRTHPESHLRHGVARPFLLNLNVPAVDLKKIKGLKITRHGTSGFEEYFVPHESKGDHFSINGDFKAKDPSDGFDAVALSEGYASLSALTYDLTDWDMTEKLNDFC